MNVSKSTACGRKIRGLFVTSSGIWHCTVVGSAILTREIGRIVIFSVMERYRVQTVPQPRDEGSKDVSR